MFASSQRAAKGKHYRNAKHCCYSAYFPWALHGAGWMSQGMSVCIPSNEIPAFLTPAVPFMSWFSSAVLTNKFIPKLGLRKSKCKGANLCLELQAESGTLLSWPTASLHARQSYCQHHALLSPWLQVPLPVCSTAELWETQIRPLLGAFSPFSKGRRAVKMLPWRQVSRAATDVESIPRMTQEMFIYSHFIL